MKYMENILIFNFLNKFKLIILEVKNMFRKNVIMIEFIYKFFIYL